jgi:hypothetical protein
MDAGYRQLFSFLGGMVLLVAAVFAVASVHAEGPMTVGSLSEWISSIVTFCAVVVALGTGNRAHRLAALTLSEQQRAQATKISWWCERIEWTDPRHQDHIRPFMDEDLLLHIGYPYVDAAGYGIICIANQSDSAVSSVILRAPPQPPEGAFEALPNVDRPVGVLPPGVTRVVVVLVAAGPTPTAESRAIAAIPENSWADWLEFTDLDGRRWQRLRDGRLLPLKKDGSPT